MECQVKLRGIRMREGRLVITMSIGRDPGNSSFQHRTEDELVWEYNNIDLEITFMRIKCKGA
jgi:hypothetical protein